MAEWLENWISVEGVLVLNRIRDLIFVFQAMLHLLFTNVIFVILHVLRVFVLFHIVEMLMTIVVLFQIVKMLVTIVVLFALCWLPLHIFFFVLTFFEKEHHPSLTLTYFICHWIAMSNSFVNPIVYSLLNDSYRVSCWQRNE